MAPKRKKRMVGRIYKTTTKVVKETVKVAVVEEGEEEAVNDSKVVHEVVVEDKELEVEDGKTNEDKEEPKTTNDMHKEVEVEVGKTNEARETEKKSVEEPEVEEGGKADKEQETKEKENDQEEPKTTKDMRMEDEVEDGNTTRKEKEPKVKEKADEEKSNKKASEEPQTPKKVEEPQAKKVSGAEGKRRRKRRIGGVGDSSNGGVGGYKRYVFSVLKQVHPELSVSAQAMVVLDMMMADMFERLAGEAARLSKYNGKATLTSREIQNAVRLVLPGELGKHAISEGTKAVTNYMANDSAN
ncbi:uncharacterized protein [Typha angustifolia]|uniref:uncharacterized protein n=1 Tax=Typha angustifolia TaxID=59011 RepID=UPI003C2B9711